jgi:hypothetical protein
MAPDKPMTSGDMIRWCGEYFKSTGVEFCGHDFVPEPVSREEDEDQWMFERLVRENMGTYEPYERTDNVFDMTQTKRFAGDIVCPEIDRTVIHRYIDFGNEDRWGKNRQKAPRIDVSAAELLSPAGEEVRQTRTVGFDVSGPGGGQYTVQFSTEGIASVDRGLPEENVPVLKVTVDELKKAVHEPTALKQLTDNDQAAQLQSLMDDLAAALAQSNAVASTD